MADSASRTQQEMGSNQVRSGTEMRAIIYTLVVNIVGALLYVLVFIVFRRCCGSSARGAARGLKKRSQSFFQREDAEQEELILRDIVLFEEGSEKTERQSARASQAYLKSVGHLFEPGALEHLLEDDGQEQPAEAEKE